MSARPLALPRALDEAIGEAERNVARIGHGSGRARRRSRRRSRGTARHSASWRLLVMGDDERREAPTAVHAAGARDRGATDGGARPLGGRDREPIHQGVGGAVVEARAEHRLRRVGRRNEGGARTPGRVLAARARAEQAQGRRAAGGGDMHQPGVVADEQRAAPQHRRRGQQIDPPDQVDSAIRRDRVEQRAGLLALVAGGQHRHARSRQRTVRSGQPRHQLGKAFGAPLLAAPVGRRADRQHRAAGRKQCRGGAIVVRCGPQPWAGRRIEVEKTPELAHAMLAQHRPWPSPGVRRRAAARPGPSRADRRRYPSAGWRPHRRAAANAATSAAFRRSAPACSPGTASNNGAATGPAAIVSRAPG